MCRYTEDTLIYVGTVRQFHSKISQWMEKRKEELGKMKDIKREVDEFKPEFEDVKQAEKKCKALAEYMKSKGSLSTDHKYKNQEDKLGGVLDDTLDGLKELDRFADAVEKLAVTSVHVFAEENQVLNLPKGISLDDVQLVVINARITCHLLIEFKRDASLFFLPRLQNIEVLSYQLDRYIKTTKSLCDKLGKSNVGPKKMRTTQIKVECDDMPEVDVQRMLDHITQLDDIRMNQNFRMVFLFQNELCSQFIRKFSMRQPRMLQCLKDLEGNALQLDKMRKGAKISSVVGSSVGAVGGVLSIIGLALIPVTAGVSLGLTMTGVGMGIGSSANSLVTTATEVGVNHSQQKKANEALKSFMKDVQVLQKCLEEATNQESTLHIAVGAGKITWNTVSIGKAIDSLVDSVSAFKVLKNEELIANVGKVAAQEAKALRSAPRVASDLPDIGQAVAKGPLALSKTLRGCFIVANAMFVGMDIFFICKDSMTLAKGSEAVFSQFIRARVALWKSEMDVWQKIHDSLHEGQQKAEEYESVLDEPFYPGLE